MKQYKADGLIKMRTMNGIYRGPKERNRNEQSSVPKVEPKPVQQNRPVMVSGSILPQRAIPQKSKELSRNTFKIQSLCVFIVCVNFSDKLSFILQPFVKQNVVHKIYVVTSAEDRDTLDTCKSLQSKGLAIQCEVYDFHHQGASFDKGCALQHIQRLGHANNSDAYLILDSDILVPDAFFQLLGTNTWKTHTLYGPKYREIYDSYQNLVQKKYIQKDICKSFFPGYFQMYTRGHTPTYTHSENAGYCDVTFFRAWPSTCTEILPFSVVHLGLIGRHWSGIQGSDFDWGLYKPQISMLYAIVFDFTHITTIDQCRGPFQFCRSLQKSFPQYELWAFVNQSMPPVFGQTLRRFPNVKFFKTSSMMDILQKQNTIQKFYICFKESSDFGSDEIESTIQKIKTQTVGLYKHAEGLELLTVTREDLAKYMSLEDLKQSLRSEVQNEPST